MSRAQSFSLGLVLAVMGIAAILQIIPVDHIWRLVSIGALGTVSLLAAMVFFVFALSRD